MNLNPLIGLRHTFEEFCRIIPDGVKADLIDGRIYMASPDSREAADLFGLLFRLIGDYAEMHGLGGVYGSRVAFRLGARGGPEPDIAFLRTDRLHLFHGGYVDGPPDLAIEIVSPESGERDYVAKRHQYREAGVPEYWIIDEEAQRLTLLRLDARGRYREIRPRDGKYVSQVLPGFFVRAEWLWQDPRPKVHNLLEQLRETGAS